MDVVLGRDDEQARRWLAQAHTEPQEWYDAAGLTRHQLVMTAAELSELFVRIEELLRPYGREARAETPPGGRRVAALFRAFPSD